MSASTSPTRNTRVNLTSATEFTLNKKTLFNPPPWVQHPKLDNCGLKVRENGRTIQTITDIAKKPCVLFGNDSSMNDIKLAHESTSRRHAMIGSGSSGNIYVMDLGSANGTFVNDKQLAKKIREPLRHDDIITFGVSTTEYIVKLDLDLDADYNKLLLEHCCLANRMYEQSKLQLEIKKSSWIDEFLSSNNIGPKNEYNASYPDETLWNIFVFGYMRSYLKLNRINITASIPNEITFILIAFSAPYSTH